MNAHPQRTPRFTSIATNLVIFSEKFRTFSGKAQMVADIRSSAEDITATEASLQSYTDCLLRVLDASKGDWGGGRFYGGGYEVTFSPMKRGGLNYLQAARITLSLDITLD